MYLPHFFVLGTWQTYQFYALKRERSASTDSRKWNINKYVAAGFLPFSTAPMCQFNLRTLRMRHLHTSPPALRLCSPRCLLSCRGKTFDQMVAGTEWGEGWEEGWGQVLHSSAHRFSCNISPKRTRERADAKRSTVWTVCVHLFWAQLVCRGLCVASSLWNPLKVEPSAQWAGPCTTRLSSA